MLRNIKVNFVTECNYEVGFGHINRCISLYHAFVEKKVVPNFIINGDDIVNDMIGNIEYCSFNWLENEKKLYDMLINSDIVIIDSYLASFSIYKKISNLVKISVYIDDTLRLEYPPGVIINTSINKKINKYKKKDNKIYLLGTKYCMLKKDFWDLQPKEINDEINTIMITFGGTDERNLTPGILKELKKFFPHFKKNVIIGKGYLNISKIEESKDENCNLIYFPTSEKMKNIMLESDVAITAGGQTVYELASIGVPAITIAIDDNQINNVQSCANLGINYYAGWWEDKNIYDKIINDVSELKSIEIRRKMMKLGRKFIKPDGSRRIIEFLMKLYRRNK